MNINTLLRYDVYGPTTYDLGLYFSYKKNPQKSTPKTSHNPSEDISENNYVQKDNVLISQEAYRQAFEKKNTIIDNHKITKPDTSKRKNNKGLINTSNTDFAINILV